MSAVQTINPERAWAEGMDQDEFEVAYHRKYGQVDTIPHVHEWIYKQTKRGHGINLPPMGEEPLDDKAESEVAKKKKKIEDEKKAGFICKGCGKEAKAKIGLISHQRACKQYLNLR